MVCEGNSFWLALRHEPLNQGASPFPPRMSVIQYKVLDAPEAVGQLFSREWNV